MCQSYIVKPNLHRTVTGLLHAIRGGVNTISPFF